jgi:hypothetical protein
MSRVVQLFSLPPFKEGAARAGGAGGRGGGGGGARRHSGGGGAGERRWSHNALLRSNPLLTPPHTRLPCRTPHLFARVNKCAQPYVSDGAWPPRRHISDDVRHCRPRQACAR